MRKLYRSTRDRKLFGVCGGLAEYMGVDATLLRILLIIVAVFSGGTVILVYIIAGFVIPKEETFPPAYGSSPYGHSPYGQNWHGGHSSPGGAPGWNAGHQHQQPYGTQGWPNGNWPGAATPPQAGPAAAGYATPSSSSAARPASQGLDAMMEDIEKKAMKKEIEELKIRLAKFEQNSKGE